MPIVQEKTESKVEVEIPDAPGGGNIPFSPRCNKQTLRIEITLSFPPVSLLSIFFFALPGQPDVSKTREIIRKFGTNGCILVGAAEFQVNRTHSVTHGTVSGSPVSRRSTAVATVPLHSPSEQPYYVRRNITYAGCEWRREEREREGGSFSRALEPHRRVTERASRYRWQRWRGNRIAI